MTDKKDYDPINTFWLPVCEEDTKKIQGQSCETVYLAADEQSCKEFLKMGTLTGVCEATGETVSFKIRPFERYWQSMDRLYRLFISNQVPWQTVHLGHPERFFDLIPLAEDGKLPETDWVIQDDRWRKPAKRGMMLLWNIQQIAVHSREYRVPCVDEVFYEHVFYLQQEETTGDGYLVDAAGDILSIRYEQNRIVVSVWTMDLPTSYQQDYHGTFISNGITFSTADNRIEIACREGISTCDGEAFDLSLAGKYVDIELSDGTVLACIIGGSKGNELGSDPTGVVHHDGSIFELLETEGVEGRVRRNGNENADKADLLHGCDIVGAYVYSKKRLYDSTTGEYTYYFSESIYN